MNKHLIEIDDVTFRLFKELKNKFYPKNSDDLVVFFSLLSLNRDKKRVI